jgi:hypothetical protein
VGTQAWCRPYGINSPEANVAEPVRELLNSGTAVSRVAAGTSPALHSRLTIAGVTLVPSDRRRSTADSLDSDGIGRCDHSNAAGPPQKSFTEGGAGCDQRLAKPNAKA